MIAGILLLVLGAILKDFLPFAWRGFTGVCAWLGRRIGGRFAFRYFERTYLDWLVTQLRELKLTGIVTSDATKKPRLEQVFVTLRMGGEKDEVSFMDCAVAVCNEIRRNPRKGGSLLEALRRDLERAPAEQRKEAEEYIARSVKDKKLSKGSAIPQPSRRLSSKPSERLEMAGLRSEVEVRDDRFWPKRVRN